MDQGARSITARWNRPALDTSEWRSDLLLYRELGVQSGPTTSSDLLITTSLGLVDDLVADMAADMAAEMATDTVEKQPGEWLENLSKDLVAVQVEAPEVEQG